jgi:hypothetical protein
MVSATALILFGTFAGVMGFILIRQFWNIFQNMLWPIAVVVGMQRGESIVWDDSEKGKLISSKDGYQVVRLKKRRHNIKPPRYLNLGLTNKGKPRLELLNVTAGQYYPIQAILPKFKNKKITKEELNDPKVQKEILDALNGKVVPFQMLDMPKKEIVEDASAKNWGVQELKRTNDVYRPKEGWFAKYGTFIMSAILAATIIFTMMFFAMKMETISANFNGAATQIRDGLYVSKGLSPPSSPIQNVTQPAKTGNSILGMTIP